MEKPSALFVNSAKEALDEIALRQRIMDGNIPVTDPATRKTETRQRPASHWAARQAMARHFFGLEEAIIFLGAAPSPEVFTALEKIPYSLEELLKYQHTHVLVADLGISIKQLFETNISLFHHVDQASVFEREPFVFGFTAKAAAPCWRLIGKTTLPAGSVEREIVPTARALVYAAVGFSLARGMTFFDQGNALCFDKVGGGNERFDFGRSTHGMLLMRFDSMHPVNGVYGEKVPEK
ncbi:MAG: hypothetical protein V1902_01770 [Candidatus Falkowbacteria bacterium]